MKVEDLKQELNQAIGDCGLLDSQKKTVIEKVTEVIEAELEDNKINPDERVREVVDTFLRRNTGLKGGVDDLSTEESNDLERIIKDVWR